MAQSAKELQQVATAAALKYAMSPKELSHKIEAMIVIKNCWRIIKEMRRNYGN